MLKIGLTGGIGCGKSTVAQLFGAKGIPVLDADRVARELVEPDQPALAAIVDEFGEEVLVEGRLNREALRKLIFADPERKRTLEGMLHPEIYRILQERAESLPAPYCILMIPLLVETGQPGVVDRILVVDCPREKQFEQIRKRDSLDDAAIESIVRSQATREARLEVADEVIENDGRIERLKEQVDRLHESYLALALGRSPAANSRY
ncbi:MAG: dephospho-CoA kinase [Methylococcaceae bacterium]|nr:dephospho-CoA kinase [Methylococcaceae bacterium]